MTSSEQQEKDLIILLHGIWVGPVVMKILARRFREAGFQTKIFGYSSVFKSARKNAERLHRWTETIEAKRIHFVAHSYGGIVLMHYFNRFHDSRPGRVVLLASPISGSVRASQLSRVPILSYLLGKSMEQGLSGGAPACPHDKQVGMIAGTRSFGVANLLGAMNGENDGAVLLTETRSDALTDHIFLPVCHTGMLFSAQVAHQAVHFLNNGRFESQTK
jgi:pimeloyl-ACP methyl ester carboxylesterase